MAALQGSDRIAFADPQIHNKNTRTRPSKRPPHTSPPGTPPPEKRVLREGPTSSGWTVLDNSAQQPIHQASTSPGWGVVSHNAAQEPVREALASSRLVVVSNKPLESSHETSQESFSSAGWPVISNASEPHSGTGPDDNELESEIDDEEIFGDEGAEEEEDQEDGEDEENEDEDKDEDDVPVPDVAVSQYAAQTQQITDEDHEAEGSNWETKASLTLDQDKQLVLFMKINQARSYTMAKAPFEKLLKDLGFTDSSLGKERILALRKKVARRMQDLATTMVKNGAISEQKMASNKVVGITFASWTNKWLMSTWNGSIREDGKAPNKPKKFLTLKPLALTDPASRLNPPAAKSKKGGSSNINSTSKPSHLGLEESDEGEDSEPEDGPKILVVQSPGRAISADSEPQASQNSEPFITPLFALPTATSSTPADKFVQIYNETFMPPQPRVQEDSQEAFAVTEFEGDDVGEYEEEYDEEYEDGYEDEYEDGYEEDSGPSQAYLRVAEIHAALGFKWAQPVVEGQGTSPPQLLATPARVPSGGSIEAPGLGSNESQRQFGGTAAPNNLPSRRASLSSRNIITSSVTSHQDMVGLSYTGPPSAVRPAMRTSKDLASIGSGLTAKEKLPGPRPGASLAIEDEGYDEHVEDVEMDGEVEDIEDAEENGVGEGDAEFDEGLGNKNREKLSHDEETFDGEDSSTDAPEHPATGGKDTLVDPLTFDDEGLDTESNDDSENDDSNAEDDDEDEEEVRPFGPDSSPMDKHSRVIHGFDNVSIDIGNHDSETSEDEQDHIENANMPIQYRDYGSMQNSEGVDGLTSAEPTPRTRRRIIFRTGPKQPAAPKKADAFENANHVMNSSVYQVIHLTCDTYPAWKQQIRLVLQAHRAWGIIDGSITRPAPPDLTRCSDDMSRMWLQRSFDRDAKEYEETRASALAWMKLTMGPEKRDAVDCYKDPKILYEDLEQEFMPRGISSEDEMEL